MMYAFGHGIIVFIVGLITIFIGIKLPAFVQNFLEFCVSLTLLVLGAIILRSLFQNRKDYQLKSRLKIVSEFILKRVKNTRKEGATHSPMVFGTIGAFIVGMIHGIGVESPSQIAIITNVAGLDNITAATIQLILFVLGLLVSTVLITFLLSWGFIKAKFKERLYIILGSATGIFSIVLGLSMLAEIVKGGI